MAATLAPYIVVVPTRLAPSRAGRRLYVRRRVLVSLVLVALAVPLWSGVGTVLANRGGEPASTPTVRPALAPEAVYVAQPGDTLWSIAARFRGAESQAEYVDLLIERNGGSALVVGQTITLP